MSFSGGTTVSPLLLVTNPLIAIHAEHYLCFGPDCPFGLREQWKSMVMGMREAKAK